MTLRELVSDPGLGLTVLTGCDKLDRPVEWVHPTDMLDPSAYLASGELVLTNGLWLERPGDSAAFVSHLARAGVHGLVFAVYPDQHTPPELVAACESEEVPLLELRDLPFRTVSEAVLNAMIADRETAYRVSRSFDVAVSRAVADGEGVAGITRRLEAELAAPCIAFARDGAMITVDRDRVGDPWPTWLAAVTAARQHPRPDGIALGGRTLFITESAGLGPKVPEGYLIVCKPLQEIGSEHRVLVDVATDHMRMEFSRMRAIRITERRFARGVLEVFRAETISSSERETHLHTLGFERDDVLVVLEASNDSQKVDVPVLVLEAALSRLRYQGRVSSALVVVSGRTATAVAALSQPPPIRRPLEDAITQLCSALDVHDITVGVSDPVDGGVELGRAWTEARDARSTAERRGERPSIVGRADSGSCDHLLALVDRHDREHHREEVLGSLLSDDSDGGALLATLAAYLRTCGSLAKTSRDLKVHVNTVRLRLAKIESMTGRDLNSMDDRVDFYVALESGRMAKAKTRE